MRDRLPGAPLALLLAIACAWTGGGCTTTPPVSKIANETTPARVALNDFVLFFANKVESAADEIAEKSTEPAIRRSTVYWKMRVIPMIQNSLNCETNAQAIMQIWVMAATMLQVFQGALGEQFGEQQPIAQEAAAELEERAKSLAKNLLMPELYEKVEPQISKIVNDNAKGMNLDVSNKQPVTWGESLGDALSKPLDLIRVPVSSLNPTSGLSDTALAMQNFTDEFTRARTDMIFMPRRIRWQVQLLLLEAEESVNISGMADGVAQLGAGADSMAQTAKTLPDQLRTELTAFAKDLGDAQGELQATLREANTTLANSRDAAQALDTMGTTFTTMFAAFDTMLHTMGVDEDDTPSAAATSAPAADPASEGPPFDINDYGRTAEKLTETAHALTALLEKTEGLADTSEPPPLLVDTEASARALLDRFFLGSAVLIVFWAAVAYTYRRLTARHRAA